MSVLAEAALDLSQRCGLCPVPIAGHDWTLQWTDAKTQEPVVRSLRKAPAFVKAGKPALFKWKQLEGRHLTEPEIRKYFEGVPNLAVVFGKTSGFAECIDFDEPGYFEEWCELLEEHGHEDLLRKLVVQATQTPGHYQAMYRCPEGVEGNKKLAMRPATEAELLANPGQKVYGIIETRGEGGYALVPPSAEYRLVQGDLGALPTLSSEERRVLWDFARHFDAMPPQEAAQRQPREPGQASEGLLPGDDFDRRADWHDVLPAHGWVPLRTRGRLTAWTRPGGDKGATSAHTGLGHGELDFMVVFSTNAYPLEPTPAKYGKFRAYAALSFPNLSEADRQSAAAKELYAKGYGERAKPKTSEQRVNDHSPAGATDQEGATADGHSPDVRTRSSKWRIMRPSEVLETPDKRMLVSGLIGQEDRWMWAGAPGCGKTFGVLNLLASCALGGEFAHAFDVPNRLRVAYCSSEGQYAMKNRLRAVLAQFGATLADVEDWMRFVADVPQYFDKDGDRSVWGFAEALEEEGFRPDVLVLDTLNKASLGSKEVDNSEAAMVCDVAARVGKRLGCSTGFVHHTGWDTKDARPRGASAFHGDMDVILLQTLDDETKAGEIKLFKGKDIKPFRPIPFDLLGVEEFDTAVMSFERAHPEEAEMGAMAKVLAAMAKDPAKEWWTVKELEKATVGTGYKAIDNVVFRHSHPGESRLFEWDGNTRPKRYRRLL